MATEQKTMTLFCCIPNEIFNIGSITDGTNPVVPISAWLRKDLTELIRLKDKFASPENWWWVARVECLPEQVSLQPDGWYQAQEKILAPDGYIPSEDAVSRYARTN